MTSDSEKPGADSGAEADPGRPPDSPRRIGHYRILEELGRGAQGVVFLAEDENLHRNVALKILIGPGAQSEAVRDRFVREAVVASKLDHPGICGVHDYGEEDGNPFIAMQYVRGTTLEGLIKGAQSSESGEPIDDASQSGTDTVLHAGTTMTMTSRDGKVATHDILRLIERAARALHAAHEAGLVHRDIKPGNIMITPDGDPVLLDFGLARDVDSDAQALTQTGQIMGTPAYLAPEQLIGEREDIDRRTDVYGMGVTLFESLTLRRPFEAKSWDQLFQKILHAEPADPRKFNSRIPQDLRTVIEVAMERDRGRRYATAAAFADDLRRVRAFEPIQAKAAGLVLRLTKWSRRQPARAVSIIAVIAFVMIGAAFLLIRNIATSQAFTERLETAEAFLQQAKFGQALEAVAQASEYDPTSAEVVELKGRIGQAQERAELESRRAADELAAHDARRESAEIEEDWLETRKRIVALGRQISGERSQVFDSFAPDTERGEFASRELQLNELVLRAANLRRRAEQALDRAAHLEIPWGGPSTKTNAAFAAFYLRRWREATARGAKIETNELRELIELYDTGGAHTEELLGRGTIAVTTNPADATVYLFRYEPYEELREGEPIPRLVPMPASGSERALPDGLPDGFRAGDPCLLIRSVEPGSLAATQGLASDDLVLRIDGANSGGGVFLDGSELPPALAEAGVSPNSRIRSINGFHIRQATDWGMAPPPPDGDVDRVAFHGNDDEVMVDRGEVRAVRAETAAGGALPRDVRLTCLRGDGRVIEWTVPAGQESGLSVEVTAYPLLRGPGNRLGTGATSIVEPGSYLLLAECAGFESQRLALYVDRRGEVRAEIAMLEEGSTPPGFVYVPPGSFVFAGDPHVLNPRPAEDITLPGFFIARHELTNREWYEFVNDPATLAEIRASESPIYLPRDVDGKHLVHERDDGTGYDWWAYRAPAGDERIGSTPVLGVSRDDVAAYVAWRNRRAEANGERWRYDLPTEQQWEKAARGVDGRTFPWGDRLDLSLMVNRHYRPGFLLDTSIGFEPRDESPFGVRDVAGSREEWTRDPIGDPAEPLYVKRGGHWGTAVGDIFRVANGTAAGPTRAASTQGVRLVARPVD